MVGPIGSCVWHRAQTDVTLRSVADVYCLHVLQQMADDTSFIILPDATHTCMQEKISQCCTGKHMQFVSEPLVY